MASVFVVIFSSYHSINCQNENSDFKVKMLIQISKNHKAQNIMQNMQFSYYKESENRQDKKKLK